jgi:RNA recognition motif-containing protein
VKKKKQLSRADADEEYLSKYDVNRRSVFVGGVPVDTDEEEMIDFFSEVGDVVNVDIVKRTTHGKFPPRPQVDVIRSKRPNGNQLAILMRSLSSSFRGPTFRMSRSRTS